MWTVDEHYSIPTFQLPIKWVSSLNTNLVHTAHSRTHSPVTGFAIHITAQLRAAVERKKMCASAKHGIVRTVLSHSFGRRQLLRGRPTRRNSKILARRRAIHALTRHSHTCLHKCWCIQTRMCHKTYFIYEICCTIGLHQIGVGCWCCLSISTLHAECVFTWFIGVCAPA